VTWSAYTIHMILRFYGSTLEILLKIPVALWYGAFALRNAVRRPFILFRELCNVRNVFQWNLQPKSRSDSRHAPSIPILIQDIPACFAPRRFLKRRLTADIPLSAFFFSRFSDFWPLNLPSDDYNENWHSRSANAFRRMPILIDRENRSLFDLRLRLRPRRCLRCLTDRIAIVVLWSRGSQTSGRNKDVLLFFFNEKHAMHSLRTSALNKLRCNNSNNAKTMKRSIDGRWLVANLCANEVYAVSRRATSAFIEKDSFFTLDLVHRSLVCVSVSVSASL